MNTLTENEKFDLLWDQMKQRIREARGERSTVYTYGGHPGYETEFGGRVNIGKVDRDGTSLIVHKGVWGGLVHLNRQDLLTIAAHCLAAAEELDELKTKP